MLRVAICGLDGIGKTTLILKLKERLVNEGFSVSNTRVSFICKDLIDSKRNCCLREHEIVKRIGMAFDFAEHYYNLDVAADVLICDRYDIDFEVLNDTYNIPQTFKDIMHEIFMKAPRLDLCFYLRADDFFIASERLNNRGNRKENESNDILSKMQESFERRIKDYPNIVVLDATLSEDEIANEAYVCVLNALNGQ